MAITRNGVDFGRAGLRYLLVYNEILATIAYPKGVHHC
jgi:hypothetical protein